MRRYRGWKRPSDYWTRSDTVACLDYASLLALKWCPAGRRILAGVGALRSGIGVSGFWGLDGFRCSNRRRAVVAPSRGGVRDRRAGFCRARSGTRRGCLDFRFRSNHCARIGGNTTKPGSLLRRSFFSALIARTARRRSRLAAVGPFCPGCRRVEVPRRQGQACRAVDVQGLAYRLCRSDRP